MQNMQPQIYVTNFTTIFEPCILFAWIYGKWKSAALQI